MKYVTKVSSKIKDQGEFNNLVQDILNDERSWGNVFLAKYKTDDCLVINLVPKEDIRYFEGKLSYYDRSIHQIFINEHNWNGGSKSKLPLGRYRTYVINHEVGHALGLDHPTTDLPSNGKAPVMMQMSKGPDYVYPLIENEWPLDEEKTKLSSYTGGNISYNAFYLYLLIILVCYVVLFTKVIPYIRENLFNIKCSKLIR